VGLPDHMHMIMTLPSGDNNYSLRWSLIKGNFSRNINPFKYREIISSSCKQNRERGIWQRRFWEHLTRDDNEVEHYTNYIHYNPVKHGYVTSASKWKFSSIHQYIAKGMIPPGWGNNCKFQEPGYGE